MKKRLFNFLLVSLSLIILSALTSCTDSKTDVKENPSIKSSIELQENTAAQNEENTSSQDEVPGKYSDMEIYEKDGIKYGKTDDGTEVEISGENLQNLMSEYMKVKGTKTDEEKNLLDKLQVILDNSEEINQN